MPAKPKPDAPVLLPIRLAWGEMDALGHVNNVVYFRYFESSRVAYIDRLGWRPIQKTTGIGFILQSVQARFRRPLVYPDTILVSSRLIKLEPDRFTLAHEVYSETLQDIAAVGEGTIVIYDYRAGAKVNMPDDLEKRIHALEAGQRPSPSA
ncbi:MAG: acyl-CoA thioesterase [Tepidisphaera sp.]|nr:acyl-CoA thioesterase [Tepidisphaera sp.]